jgi:tRNA(Arg) A34 adenosine deaminase TadA
MEHPKKEFMSRAIELSRFAGIERKSGGVFGAVLVKENQIIAEGFNRVIEENDPTCHAEMDAIRKAGKKLKTPFLKGCVLYTSAFCCPMCLCAAYWAHIDKIYYAATVEDAKKYGDFADVDYYEEMNKSVQARAIPSFEFMRAEALEVWKEFSKLSDRARY